MNKLWNQDWITINMGYSMGVTNRFPFKTFYFFTWNYTNNFSFFKWIQLFFNKKLSTIFSPTKTTYWSIVLIYIILIWKAKAQMHCESTWTSQWGYWAAWRWQTEGRCPSWWIPPACGVWPHTWVRSPPRTPRGQRNRPAPRLLRQSEK